MKYVRVQYRNENFWGILTGEQVQLLDQAPYAAGKPTGVLVDLLDCRLLAPCEPSKIVAVGKNYFDHIQEFDSQVPETPILFIKPSTSLLDPGEPIRKPDRAVSERVDYEGELAFVISQRASQIKPEEADRYILGYTCLNDVTARDVQKKDGQWTRAKGFDTFAPVGPILTDEIDPAHLTITTRLNGNIKQQAATNLLIWSVADLLAFITQAMTLLPGDVVTTGTPAGVGPMQSGDVVSIEIPGIGILSNPVQ